MDEAQLNGVARIVQLRTLTQGALHDLMLCEELFRLKRLARLRDPHWSPPLVTGSAFHHGIEHRSPAAAAEYYLRARSSDMLSGEDLLRAEFGAAEALAMVEAALGTWPVAAWPQRQEVQFALDFVNPATGGRSSRHVFRGVIDGWPDDPEDGPSPFVGVLGEWKTASNPGESYFDRLQLDWQVSAYCEAASRVLGRPVRSVRYRVVRKPTIRPRRGETDAEYAQRCRDRKPLAPLKKRKSETDEQYAERSAAREAARKPLARKVPDTPHTYLNRLRDWYAAEERCYEEVLHRTEQQMERWRYEAWELHRRALDIERAHNAAERGVIPQRVPIRNDRQCTRNGVRCTFLSLCSGRANPDAYRVIDSPYPELTTGAEETEK